MADSSTLEKVSGIAKGDYNDSVTLAYRVTYDSVPTNYYDALARAQAANGTPVPVRRVKYASTPGINIYAQNFNGAPVSNEKRSQWVWSVEFQRPPAGSPQNDDYSDDPLNWPVEYNVEYIDREYVIEKAKNVSALSHGDGNGGNRGALTLGPIVNAAGKRPDEPIVETERLEVLVIKKNYASLSEITTRNRTYKRTTNSDSTQGYTARQLRYLLTESLGRQFEGATEYWPGVTKILAEKSTDLTLDNVGYEYWDGAANNWARAKDKDGNDTAEPIKLALDGDKGGTTTTTISYRHLDEVAYASLFT